MLHHTGWVWALRSGIRVLSATVSGWSSRSRWEAGMAGSSWQLAAGAGIGVVAGGSGRRPWVYIGPVRTATGISR
jgi:hypothetical protein